MEDKTLNEKESLELISRMIQNTKKHMELGEGNSLLLWGYTMVGVASLVYLLLLFTGNNPVCHWAWWLIPVIGGGTTFYWERKKTKYVKTYTDSVIASVWGGIGFAFFGTILMMIVWNGWVLMIPLSLLYVSIGVYMMGNILRDKWISRLPTMGIVMGIIILIQMYKGVYDWNFYFLVYIVCSILVLVIPGHIINRQAKKEALVCSEN